MIIYNKLYPVKVWLSGLSILSLWISLGPHDAETKGNVKATLDDFTPFFMNLFMITLASLPFFLLYYITFVLLGKRHYTPIKAKLILVSGMLFLSIIFVLCFSFEYFLYSANIITLLAMVTPVICSTCYFNISSHSPDPD